jgi:hypothetical protein
MNKKSIVNSTQKVISKNYVYCSGILRLAFKYLPRELSKIIRKINKLDRKIPNLTPNYEKKFFYV